MTNPVAFLSLPSGMEWLVVALIALLFFGRKLPEVARSLGKSIVEFKRGIRDTQQEIETSIQQEERNRSLGANGSAPPPAAPRFPEPAATTSNHHDQPA